MTSHSEFGKETTSEQVVDVFASEIRGKTVLITGVSPNGLGSSMALAIASKQPSMLILTARTPSKAEAVTAELKSSYPVVTVQVLQLDLSSQKSVRRAALRLTNLTTRIDILLNNAGVMAIPERTLSEDGIEMHLATNFLGHYLFTNLLLSQSILSSNSRIVNVSGGGYVLSPFRFSDYNYEGKQISEAEQPDVKLAGKMGLPGLDAQGGYQPMLAYTHSNTAVMLFSVALAERLRKRNICIFSVAPGVAETGIQRHMPLDFRNPIMFYKTPSQAAATFLVAALDPALTTELSGAYLDDCQISPTAEHGQDRKAAERLWELGEELVGETFEL